MSLYAGNHEQFRVAASPAVLAVVCAAAFVAAAGMASLVVSLADLALGYAAGWPGPVALYAPLLARQNGLIFSSPPLAPSYALAPLAVPAISAVISFGVLFFWPTEQKLATRLFAHALAIALAIAGVAAPALDRHAIADTADTTGTSPALWMLVFSGIALLIVLLSERRALSMLANLYDLGTPGERLTSWILRIPIGLTLVAMLCLANNYLAGVYAAGGAVLVSLLVSLAGSPRREYERLGNPMMSGAAIILPMIAVILTVVMTLLFGMQAAGIRPRAAVISINTGLTLEPLRLIQPSGPIDSPYATPAASPSPSPEEKKIDMKWSKQGN